MVVKRAAFEIWLGDDIIGANRISLIRQRNFYSPTAPEVENEKKERKKEWKSHTDRGWKLQ